MKTYFSRLFNYDRYANDLILNCIIDGNAPEKPVQLFAHLLAAQQIWLNRCRGLPPAQVELWPSPINATDHFARIVNENCLAWQNYLGDLDEDAFNSIIYYKNTKGVNYESELVNIIAHVINHGTHHRAQIGQQLKFAGLNDLPNTDYIFYLMQL